VDGVVDLGLTSTLFTRFLSPAANLPEKTKPAFRSEDGWETTSVRLYSNSGFPDGDFHNFGEQIGVAIRYSPFYLSFPKLDHKNFGVSLF